MEIGRKRKRKNRIKRRESRTAWLFLLPSILGVFIFMLMPFGDVIRRSFYDAMGKKAVGFENYKTVFSNGAFQLAAGNTLKFLLVCIPFLLLVSILLSLLIVGRGKSRSFFKVSYLIPLAIPVASVVLLWKLFFYDQGLLNGLIQSFGGKPINWMNTDKAFYVLVFSYLWKNSGYDMVLWLAGLENISGSLYEAASIDGAGHFAKFRYITLPELKPTVKVIVVLSLVNSFKVFREAYLVAGNYPHQSMYLLQHLFNNWFGTLDVQKMCAGAVITALAMILFLLLVYRRGKGEEDI